MKIEELLFILSFGMTLTGCSGCTNSDYHDEEDYFESSMVDDYIEDYGQQDNVENGNQYEIRLTGIIETCNKCMGYGLVQDGLYGQPETCMFCWISTYMRMEQGWTGFNGSFGQVDAVFNTLPADYFKDLSWNDGGSEGSNTNQIEAEIEQHERNIEAIEHQLEYIEGAGNRIYLEQQLIEERYEIRRLQEILNNMN